MSEKNKKVVQVNECLSTVAGLGFGTITYLALIVAGLSNPIILAVGIGIFAFFKFRKSAVEYVDQKCPSAESDKIAREMKKQGRKKVEVSMGSWTNATLPTPIKKTSTYYFFD